MNIKVEENALRNAVRAVRMLIVSGVVPVARTLYRAQQERIEVLRETNARLERVERKPNVILDFTDPMKILLAERSDLKNMLANNSNAVDPTQIRDELREAP